MRSYAVGLGVVPPDYARFCGLHARHRLVWRLTYEPGQVVPYRAYHRVEDGLVVAADTLDELAFALEEFTAPIHAHSGEEPVARFTIQPAREVDR
ncbi:hypothetical protein GCM10022402_45390 [Salinactinospora qingdaonensis]|uniref:Uncharacterized protein n=1 Tax=Salinactinospora qingdaonensis TaxID=702744 RepID=A0ABP7GGS8_9ACTN